MRDPSVHPPPSRPVAMGVNGMVSSAHPLASNAGLRVLMDGGNAFHAAVATACTLNVVEPYMSGLGGIGLALAYVAKEGRVRALNFSGRAPLSAEPSLFTEETKGKGILAALVPGNPAGWLTLHKTYGSMGREKLFRQAIDYAENGFPITYLNSKIIGRGGVLHPDSERILLDESGRPPAPGARLRMPALAESFRAVVSGGLEEFYRGDLARRIVEGNRALGGLFTEEDLATYQAEWQEPISIDYRGYQVFVPPPNSSGFQVLQTLKLMGGYEVAELALREPERLHLFIEAAKLCITDRIKYAGDPDHVEAPLSGLLSNGCAAAQRGRIEADQAAAVSGEHYTSPPDVGALLAGSAEGFDGGMTTHFGVADRDGNVVTVTQTLGGGFGTGAAVGGTGIFLNNMANWFDLDEGSPNRIGPGKKVDFVVAPTQTLKDGRFFLSMGTPGSWGILQTTPQLVMNVLDLGMNVQQAIDAPRLRCTTGREVQMEERFPLHVRRALEAKGHEVDVAEAWSMSVGGAQGIVVDAEQGVFQGGADLRRDGYALGY